MLKERLDNYKTAIANAEASGESSKARRYARGAKVGIYTLVHLVAVENVDCMRGCLACSCYTQVGYSALASLLCQYQALN